MPKAGSICIRSSFAALLLCANAWSQEIYVSAVRHWSLGDVTRIAIETTGEFRYLSDRLSGPDRIFFDFPGAGWKISRKAQHVIPVGDALLKQIRVAETNPGVTRVVLDLAQPSVLHSASQLSNPDRLVVELRVGSPRPIETVTSSVRQEKPPGRKFEPPAGNNSGPAQPVLPSPPVIRASKPSLAAEQTSVNRELAAARIPPAPSPVEEKTTEPAVIKTTAPAPAEASKLAAPAKRPSSGGSSLTRALGLKVGRVLLDAGHGGHDTGSVGLSGLLEKDLVLDVTRRLGELIEKKLGAEVIYTRTDDSFLSLEARAEMANEKKADLFLSIHANSSPLRAVSGAETYYLSFTTSRTALEVAARENAGSQRTVHELEEILQKIALKEKVDESREFALKIQSALAGLSKSAARPRDRGVKKAPFVVLIGASMPSVLAEIGFLSNTREETLLKQPEHRQRIAEALYNGLSQYAGTLSHFQVARTDSSLE